MVRFVAFSFVLSLGVASSALATPAVVPQGDELVVNGYTTGLQSRPSVRMADDGGFVVIWTDLGPSDGGFGNLPGQDGDATGVVARSFTPHGAPRGGEILINDVTADDQVEGRVALQPGGGFVVTWWSEASPGSDADSWSVQARRFDEQGTPAAPQFQVNAYTVGPQWFVEVAADADGDFIVVWQDESGEEDPDLGIRAQRYAADAMPLGSAFQVNSDTAEPQYNPALGLHPSGAFVVVWSSQYGYATAASIQAQRFDADGVPAGGPFRVDEGLQPMRRLAPEVAVLDDQRTLVTWHEFETARGRLIDAVGVPIGSEIDLVPGAAVVNLVAAGRDEGFLLAWTEGGQTVPNGPDGDGATVMARWLAADGRTGGDPFVVNTFTTGEQNVSSVAAAPGGRFVVAWTSGAGTYGAPPGPDGADAAAVVRRVAVPVFGDGFESGDTTAWDIVVPASAGVSSRTRR